MADEKKEVASRIFVEKEMVQSCRVSIEDLASLGAELFMLREQVRSLQQMGTAQLEGARFGAFEMAARVCDAVAEKTDAEVMATPTSPERNELTVASMVAKDCAMKIRTMAEGGKSKT